MTLRERLSLNPDKVIHEVCAVFDGKDPVTREDILGRSKPERIVLARQMVYYILRQRGLTFKAIGAMMGRNHSTVVLGVSQMEFRIKTDKEIRELMGELCKGM
jgi:chromosomal replication initiation ATPase DnaA